jgi:hypothetical protein
MGKETREMLRTIISNQELIIRHLNINRPEDNILNPAEVPANKKKVKSQPRKKDQRSKKSVKK